MADPAAVTAAAGQEVLSTDPLVAVNSAPPPPSEEPPENSEAVDDSNPTGLSMANPDVDASQKDSTGAATDAVSVSIVADQDPRVAATETNVLVRVETPKGSAREPVDLVVVIDTSGSMGAEATIQGSSGTTERHGLTLLDVAKHGCRTIVKTLGEKDRVAIVSFNHQSTTVSPLTKMDEAGQAAAETKLDQMYHGGGTNIWEGIKNGLDALRENLEKGRLGHIMVLTDGETNNRDTVKPNLKQYEQQYERLPGTINTFGFGYRLDSPLLVDLAEMGSGSYSFIPDAGFVGTAFVNTMSNLLVTMAREVYLMLAAENDAEIVNKKVYGGYPVEDTGSSLRVNLGTLQYGQTKDVVLPMMIKSTSDEYLVCSLSYESPAGETIKTKPVDACAKDAHGTDAQKVIVDIQRNRCIFADVIPEALDMARQNNLDGAMDAVKEATKKVRYSFSAAEKDVAALLEDMEGQSSEAFSKREFYDKWGKHYMPSVMFAHRLQQCNNFKDPGVQVYGGDLYTKCRDAADDVFNELPAPKPSIPQRHSISHGSAPAAAPVSMSAYNDRYCG